MEENKILEVKNVTKKYKNFTLDNVSFDVFSNDIVGFVGENGAGKSTTLKAISNLINLNAGEIKIFNKEYDYLTQVEREEISVVLDEICLPEKLSLIQVNNIFKNIFKNWAEKTYYFYLEKFNIQKDKKIKELSKGMKAKLNLAIAFSHNAKFLMLDEPMNGLDPVARDEVIDILLEFNQVEGRAIIISSHIISDLEKLCNKILLIHNGKIAINESKEILNNSFNIVENLTKEEFDQIDKNILIRYKIVGNSYSILIKRENNLPFKQKEATLEDAIVFMIRGKTL